MFACTAPPIHALLSRWAPLCALLLAVPALATTVEPSDEPDPAAVVARLHDALQRQSPGDIDARVEALAPVVETSHDLESIARFVLRRTWRELTVEQRMQFIDRFREFSVMNYASRFTDLPPDAFRIDGTQQSRPDRADVAATLTAPQRRVALTYTLQHGNDGWRIINVFADGVSDLALRRADYTRIIDERGFDGLLAYLDEQIAELR